MSPHRILVAAVVAFFALGVAAQDGAKPSNEVDAVADRGPKTPEHERLALFAGEWDIQLTMHGGPEPVTVTAVASEKLVHDGLYLVMTVSSHMGDDVFEGRGITGYDRHAKEYVSVWIASDANTPSFSRGTFDPESKTMTMVGEMSSPGGVVKTRTVTDVKDPDRRTEKVYAKGPDGAEKPFMDFVFTRRKEPARLEPAKVDPKALPEEVTRLAGDWTGTFSMTAKTDAGSVPAGTCTATESSTLICGGKWIWTDMQAELGGRSHAGSGVLGYDSKTGKYTSVGWDNQNGTFAVAHGTSDGKTRSMEGTVVDPTGTKKAWWESSSWTDSDHRVLTWKVAGTASAPEMHVDAKYERAK